MVKLLIDQDLKKGFDCIHSGIEIYDRKKKILYILEFDCIHSGIEIMRSMLIFVNRREFDCIHSGIEMRSWLAGIQGLRRFNCIHIGIEATPFVLLLATRPKPQLHPSWKSNIYKSIINQQKRCP